jgi:hypothetical protein
MTTTGGTRPEAKVIGCGDAPVWPGVVTPIQ